MAAMMKGMLLVMSMVLLIGCSSSLPKVDPQKRYVRYFPPTKERAYSLYPPDGPWFILLGGEYSQDATDLAVFTRNAGPYVDISVAFRLRELRPTPDNARTIWEKKYFFNNGRLSKNLQKMDLITVGDQGIRCQKSSSFFPQHYGPSRDPAVSGKWAGGGNTKYNRQIACPFHRGGQIFTIWADMTYTVLDAAEAAGVSVNIEELHAQVERQFERVWASIEFSPTLSQAPLPETLPEHPPVDTRPQHRFPEDYTIKPRASQSPQTPLP